MSLEVYQGDAWGIVGQNGAGKSTLLKLLCGVTLASEGQVRRAGRVSALLELGIGFHPEYTGRENLALSGALMGLGQDELDARLPAILAFADIGDFVDRPLKTYSSGMRVRLAFALATCVEPDVLVTDEILAVGDEAFQKKCIGWMEDFLSRTAAPCCTAPTTCTRSRSCAAEPCGWTTARFVCRAPRQTWSRSTPRSSKPRAKRTLTGRLPAPQSLR